MKNLIAIGLVSFISVFSHAAETKVTRQPNSAKAYTYSFAKPMSSGDCLAHIQSFARTRNFTLVARDPEEFYIKSGADKVGNAYYSQKTCYIYLN